MSRQQGIGLLELMLVLAVLMVLALSAVRYVKSTRAAARLADGVSVVQVLINATEDWMQVMRSAQGISLSSLRSRALIPATFKNPWGGSMEVLADGEDQVRFVFDGISEAECKNFSDALRQKGVKGRCGASGRFEGVYPDVS